ncbi:conserved phage C-terminal domain-containing protein [Pantoea piersonii]|uniref:conserved phage C-terminal domain-containing protein n=1 Tax=Pantoea piersonii TaxID=2364647 RepID=UPI0022F1C659|nr:conserved phage C-terminal domain-containing protein [Pantoea piersonii]WBV23011.1 conserved phage C-terminal domain-containing protein [Pantoea piersonii]
MSLLLKVKPLVISPELACRIGLNEAIVLQQICYWLEDTTSGVEHDGRRWVYNTIDEWTEQFPFWSGKTVKRAISSLKAMGLIYVEQLKKNQHDQTNFYAINHANPLLTDRDNLSPSRRTNCPSPKGQSVPMDKANLSPSIGSTCPSLTENTTENTTEITTRDSCQVAAQPDRDVELTDQAKKVLAHLNLTTGAKFQVCKSSLENIRARLAEGYELSELLLVVDYKNAHWQNTEQAQYLRPATLFIPKNFPGYLQSATKWDKSGRPPCVNGKWQRDVMQMPSANYEIPDGFRSA